MAGGMATGGGSAIGRCKGAVGRKLGKAVSLRGCERLACDEPGEITQCAQ